MRMGIFGRGELPEWLTCSIDGTRFKREEGQSISGSSLYCSEACAQDAAESVAL